MSDIKRGNVVQLKSGGPPMTVAKVEEPVASCIWFNNGTMESGGFHIDTISVVNTSTQFTADVVRFLK
jgi:uncharacterized protein YodC (DUF2158 family)